MIITVWGMGKSGLSAARVAKNEGHEVYAVDQGQLAQWKNKDEAVAIVGEQNCVEESMADNIFNFSELIVLSPGVSKSHPQLKRVRERKIEIISEIEFAARRCRVDIVAVTGSNGKTTTVSLIARALEEAGKKVFLGGNIGRPFSEMFLSDEQFDCAVIEVSSFQLEAIEEFHPKVAVILNLFPTHFERYSSMEDYAEAKWRITRNTGEGDLFICPENLPLIDQKREQLTCQTNFFNEAELRSSFAGKYDFSTSKLKGSHNLVNFYITEQILDYFNIESANKIVSQLIKEFCPIPYRMDIVGEKKALTFVNDAKSTNLAATLAAIESFKEYHSLFLIFGGQIRSDSYYQSAYSLSHWSLLANRPKKIFLIGESAETQKDLLGTEFHVQVVQSLPAAFQELKAESEGVVLFSPGHPSFDQYGNYEQRGEHFNELFHQF